MRVLRQPDEPVVLDDDLVIEGDNADVLPLLPERMFDVIYVDPPFNTGKDRRGLRDVTHAVYADSFEDYLGWLLPRLAHADRLLAPYGTLYVHLDQRESHYVKVALDELFGRERFMNEIIWAYDFGGRPTRRWPAKHDTILVYAREADGQHFDREAVDREPYMAPGLAGPIKAARGKSPTDTWWHTIVHTTGAERTGYPTQKPEGVVRRAVQASSLPGGWCLDFFAGSGTLGAVCKSLGRRYVLVDSNPAAIDVIDARLRAVAESA